MSPNIDWSKTKPKAEHYEQALRDWLSKDEEPHSAVIKTFAAQWISERAHKLAAKDAT